ncbi:type IV pilus biogenesis/stability protein PilW [Caldichromatium japonicum]|uniref:Type IV pilus biogenesis/stability protein PilW n=1 Tax=Caldichromatium japonicum TaxID=2699430 RepID=A0A6G7VGV9_9GAMM|nr:type IV pilus biogenesis/stability protein PilW [Caldichromatium japonicum]QIK39116.1 type IV pilus biogenesis/stability protein PilW [Caldichromatium japonicum]
MKGPSSILPLLAATSLSLSLAACSSKTALKGVDDTLGLTPKDSPAELYVELAKEYYRLGKNELALRHAEQAVETDERYPPAHVWLAFLFEQLRQTGKAAEHYQRALELGPNNPDVLNAYGSFLCNQRRFAEADSYFLKAADNPVYATPWIALSNAGNCALESGDTTKAETHYRAALQASPTYGYPLVKLAELAMRRGDAKAAKDYIDRYFNPQTMRTPAASQIALRVGIEAERTLGNRKQAAFYQKALVENFPNAVTSQRTP